MLKAVLSSAPSERTRRKVTSKMKRERMRKKLRRAARNAALKDFMREVKIRQGEGYSAAQLIASHIPDIGAEVRVSEGEVSGALRKVEVGNMHMHMYMYMCMHMYRYMCMYMYVFSPTPPARNSFLIGPNYFLIEPLSVLSPSGA